MSVNVIVYQILPYLSVIPREPFFQFIYLGIHKIAIPESLQEMPDESFTTIKKTTLEDVAYCEIDERAEKQWSLYEKIGLILECIS